MTFSKQTAKLAGSAGGKKSRKRHYPIGYRGLALAILAGMPETETTTNELERIVYGKE